MRKRIQRVLGAIITAALALTGAVPESCAHHAVLRFNLEEMTAAANRIFLGHCISVDETEEMIAQGILPVTRYTFEVEQAIKGRLPRRITFQQLGHPPHWAAKGTVSAHGMTATPDTFLHGMSDYKPGDRLVLFLIPDYLGGKVTYPVGLYQGAFVVSQMPSGQRLVRNGINNLGLLTAPYNGTAMREKDARVVLLQRNETAPGDSLDLSRRRGAWPLDQFVKLVENIMAAHGVEHGTIVEGKRGAIQR
ncbi:MAG TPA: hypothetical protein VFV34_12610 [Blastocatellia bacterium]|nr:hypothetical protein [Blastocatellia bacterium]